MLTFIESVRNVIIDQSYEIIVITPSEEIFDFDYGQSPVVTVFSQASPVICAHLGILNATGQFILICADDGTYFPLLNTAIQNAQQNEVHVYKFLESNNPGAIMYEDRYYTINIYPGTRCKYIPDDYIGMNEAIISKELYLKYGGFDCRFETLIIATMDLAIRLRRAGVPLLLKNEMLVHHTHHSDDPNPHDIPLMSKIQMIRDEPLFRSIYNHPDSKDRIVIDIENYKDKPILWNKNLA